MSAFIYTTQRCQRLYIPRNRLLFGVVLNMTQAFTLKWVNVWVKNILKQGITFCNCTFSILHNVLLYTYVFETHIHFPTNHEITCNHFITTIIILMLKYTKLNVIQMGFFHFGIGNQRETTPEAVSFRCEQKTNYFLIITNISFNILYSTIVYLYITTCK